MELREEFIRHARSLIGVPFRHQGRDSRLGIDCIGLMIVCANHVGIDTSKDRTDYPRQPYGVLMPILDDAMVRVEGRLPGDILVMTWRHDPMHIAIWTGNSIVHTYATLGKVVEHGLDERWEKRITGVYRFKEFM